MSHQRAFNQAASEECCTIEMALNTLGNGHRNNILATTKSEMEQGKTVECLGYDIDANAPLPSMY